MNKRQSAFNLDTVGLPGIEEESNASIQDNSIIFDQLNNNLPTNQSFAPTENENRDGDNPSNAISKLRITNATYVIDDSVNSDDENEEDDNYEDDKDNISEGIEFFGSRSKRAQSNVSFLEGRPTNEEDILKLQCPLYMCRKSTIITRTSFRDVELTDRKKKNSIFSKMNTVISKESKSTKSVVDTANKNLPTHQTLKSEKNLPRVKRQRKNAVVDIKLANTMEVRIFKSLFVTILQIINCIIRYTIIQFPFCIKILGLLYGPLIIGIIGLMSIFSVFMLITVKESTNEK
jgi:hypothetical protein